MPVRDEAERTHTHLIPHAALSHDISAEECMQRACLRLRWQMFICAYAVQQRLFAPPRVRCERRAQAADRE